jgi:hypothetical protein
MSARAGTGSTRPWPRKEPTIWEAQGLLLASFLAVVSGDHAAALALLEDGTSLAEELNDPATSGFAAYCAGNLHVLAGDLQQAIAHCEAGLAALLAGTVYDRQRANLLLCLVGAARTAGDEERRRLLPRACRDHRSRRRIRAPRVHRLGPVAAGGGGLAPG